MTEFEQLLLNETRDIKSHVERLEDKMVGFDTKLSEVERKQKWSTKVYTVLGGALAVVIAKYTGHS